MKLIPKSLIFVIGMCLSVLVLAKNEEHGEAMPPAPVEAMTVKATTTQQQVVSTGSLLAIPGIIVRPEISGRITKIFFRPGETVKQGTALVEINPDVNQAQLANAQANLKLQQLNFERFNSLYQTRTVSKAEYDKARADLESARAQVDLQSANLRQTLIRAPFDGKIGLNLINVGDYLTAGKDIASLQSLNPIYVDFPVPEVYLRQISVGQPISLASESYPDAKFTGKVFAIDPLLNQNTRTISVRGVVPNDADELLPGAFAEVTLFTSKPQEAIKIPQTAVVHDAAGNYVYRYVDGKAVKTLVSLGARDQQSVMVLNGLRAGDVVITAGQLKIFADNYPTILMAKDGKPVPPPEMPMKGKKK